MGETNRWWRCMKGSRNGILLNDGSPSFIDGAVYREVKSYECQVVKECIESEAIRNEPKRFIPWVPEIGDWVKNVKMDYETTVSEPEIFVASMKAYPEVWMPILHRAPDATKTPLAPAMQADEEIRVGDEVEFSGKDESVAQLRFQKVRAKVISARDGWITWLPLESRFLNGSVSSGCWGCFKTEIRKLSKAPAPCAPGTPSPMTTARDAWAKAQEARRQAALAADADDKRSRMIMKIHDTALDHQRQEDMDGIEVCRAKIAALEAKLHPQPAPPRKRLGWSDCGFSVRGY